MRHATALLLVAAAGAAHAGRPLQAEDAPTMEARACEVEGATSDWRGRDGGHTRQSYLQLGCGIGWGTEIALQAYQPRELGLNGKTQVFSTRRADGDAQLSLAWSLNHRRVETAWRRSGAAVILVASAPLSRDWVVHANLGHQRDELQRRRSTT